MTVSDSAARRVFLFFVSVFWLTNSGFDTSEAGFQYAVAKQFVTTGQISFDQPRTGVFDVAPDARTYGSHEFGNTLFLIPAAAASEGLRAVLSRSGVPREQIDELELFLLSFQPGIYSALTLTLLFLILTGEYGHTTRQAFFSCLALGFGTFFWNYSRSLFDGVLCGLLWMATLHQLLRYRATGRLSAVATASVLLGLSVTTRVTMAIPAAVSMLWLLSIRPQSRWSAGGVAFGAMLPFAVWQAWYNHVRTGDMWMSPVQNALNYPVNALDGSLVTGLMGHLVSPGKGLLMFAPLLITSAIVFPRFWRRDRALGILLLATGVLWLLLHSKLRSWSGAWGWGPRHLYAMLPMLALPGLVYLPSLWSVAWSRRVVTVALALGGVIAAAATVGNFHYRLQLALQEGRASESELAWGAHSQAIDMLGGAARNLAVTAGLLPPLSVPILSELNNYVSNRINLWWLTLPHLGVSWIWVLMAGVPLVAVATVTARALSRPHGGAPTTEEF